MSIRVIKLLPIVIMVLVWTVFAGETPVTPDMEKPDEGLPPVMGKNSSVSGDSGITVFTREDIGLNISAHYMNGVNGSFSSVTNITDSGASETHFAHCFTGFYGDTVYMSSYAESSIAHLIYKVYNGAFVIIDTVGLVNTSFAWTGGWGDGDSWVTFGKVASTQLAVYTIADGELGSATGPVAVDTITMGAADQENFYGIPSSNGMLLYNIVAEEMHFIETDGTTNEDAIDPCFANLFMATMTGNTYGDIGACPANVDGSNDTSYWAITDATTLHVQVYEVVTSAAGGTATLTDSSGVITTGPKPTNHLSDWNGCVNPHLTVVGDGLVLTVRDWLDTAQGGAAAGSWDTAQIAIYILQDRGDITGSWVKTEITTTAGPAGQLTAPWRTLAYDHADSSSHVVAWAAGPVYTAAYLTDITIADPSAAPPGGEWGRTPQIF